MAIARVVSFDGVSSERIAEMQREMAKRTNWGRLLTPGLLRPDAQGLPSPQDRPPPVRRPEW